MESLKEKLGAADLGRQLAISNQEKARPCPHTVVQCLVLSVLCAVFGVQDAGFRPTPAF